MKTTKRLLCALLSVMLVLTVSFALFACSDDTPTCTSHVDNNNDLLCDNCNAPVPCTNHFDNNGDMRCDRCMRPMPCTNHVDQNNDASCDKCGAYVAPTACTSHVDANGDLKCDNCGATVACTEHVDDDGDEECDKCGAEIEEERKELLLIEGGLANFQFVLAKSASTDIRGALELDIINKFNYKHDIEIPLVLEGYSNDEEMDVEVLIGDVQNRGDEYKFDKYTLGEKGYIIKIIGNKVIINAGSEETLEEALFEFAEDVIGLNGDDEIFDVIMTNEDEVVEIQDNYKVTSLAVNGQDMKGYTIAADTSNKYYNTAATLIQNTIYSRTGYRFEIVSLEEAGENSIVIKHIDKISGDKSFAIKAVGEQLVIECAYDNMIEKATSTFLLQKVTEGRGDIDFTGNVYNQDISVVYYEDFGAVGDGKTDDFAAIVRAHDVANECGQTVKATPGARYYIFDNLFIKDGAKKETLNIAFIQTNVDWGDAEFIIDDTQLHFKSSEENYGMNASIFRAIPDDNLSKITIKDPAILQRLVAEGINPTTTQIIINSDEIGGWNGPIMIVPYNDSHRVYRRRGYGGFSGGAMHEVIVLDENGNVSADTPIMFDYTDLNYVEVYRLDPSTAITIQGGVFTTKASGYNCINPSGSTSSPYVSRNINVQRSYTTVRGVKHYVTDEPTPGQQVNSNGEIILVAPTYTGFFSANNANDVLFEDCVLSGRRCYQRPEGGTGGTYDISGNEVNLIVFKDCVQHNFWVVYDEKADIIRPAQENTKGAIPSMASVTVGSKSLKMHWGIGGTNYCKNMQYLGSTLSRFDAHSGLYNGKVIDSTVNYLAITGNGEFIVENVRYFAEGTGYGSNSLFHLRSDYGSTWDGEITLKNVDAYAYFNANVYLFYHSYVNWYFGYMAGFPSISIDNLNYYDIQSRMPVAPGTKIYLASSTISATAKMHLPVSSNPTYVSIEDRDKDGFIDEPAIDLDRDGIVDPPLDLDGNGVAGNTSINYNELIAEYKAAGKDTESGISLGVYTNINIIKPPKYIKVLNNDGVDGAGGYVYVVTNTAKYKDDPSKQVSDGGWYDDVETWGGFLGDTKFYYSETEYFLGTDHVDQTITSSFSFVN